MKTIVLEAYFPAHMVSIKNVRVGFGVLCGLLSCLFAYAFLYSYFDLQSEVDHQLGNLMNLFYAHRLNECT